MNLTKPKFLIVSDQKWVLKKLPVVRNILSECPQLADVELVYDYRRLTPKVSKGRIEQEWFQEHISRQAILDGYLGAVFVASLAQAKRWKLKSGLRGSHFSDGDGFIEAWAAANSSSVVRFKDKSRRDLLPKVICHELGHGFTELGLTELEVHDFDYQTSINNIDGFYRELRLGDERPSLLKRLMFRLQVLLDIVRSPNP
ncbi:hypothetical protein [Parerythrobacter lacustris]|uniref:Uncharacterized protein n=1 Tax=Parerythrobacter lacustris TaxID=2969984 RepID=A0ABT1XP91_9SPHN|nr:hypothetical protein [Parerythrobacter lacustris]MCR2833468.1 hypothetical protein [Parerythrobacter lacustris]